MDSWVLDKVIDYSNDDSTGEYAWYLKTLSKEESEDLRNLPDKKKAFIRILHECEVDGRLGVITETDAIETLKRNGHDVEFVPFVAGKTNDFTRFTEDGESVVWHYLVPQYELSNKN